MSRKPVHHEPPDTGKDLEKCIFDMKTVPPKEKNDVVSLHHSSYAPSSLPAIALCPARVRMSFGLPELPSSEDAEEGRMLHSAVKAGDVKLDSEQLELVNECRDLIAELSENDKGHVFYEETLSVINSDHSGELTFGTCDVLILFDDKVKIIEEKYGRNEVEEAANNLQLACYAVGAAQKYCVDKVECHIFQPRIHHYSDYTFTDIPAVLASIEAVIERSKTSEWVFNPSEETCRHCRAKFICMPCLNVIEQLPVVPEKISNETLAKSMPEFIKAAKRAAKLSDAILDKAKELLTQGIPVPGYCLKAGNEVRFVADIIKAFEGTKDFIPQEEFLKLCSVSVGAYEEKFIEKFKTVNSTFADMTLDECKEEFAKRVYGAIAKKQNKPSLAEVKAKK